MSNESNTSFKVPPLPSDGNGEVKNAKSKKSNVPLTNDILKKLQNSDEMQKLNATSKTLFNRLISLLQKDAEPLQIDYHVVLFEYEKKNRYSIIEGKKTTFNFKELDFGIVGVLLTPYFKNNNSAIFVRFGIGNAVKPVVKFEKLDSTIVQLEYNEINNVFKKVDSIKWKKDKEINDFAIAATTLKNEEGNVIGAITIDFGAKSKDYPDFTFRDQMVKMVFDTLYTMKSIFEILIKDDFSDSFRQAIKIISEVNIDE